MQLLVVYFNAFFLMFRKSNLVPNTVATFDSKKQRCRKNFTFDEKRNVLITIQWSKAIQFGERTLVIPLVCVSRFSFMSSSSVFKYAIFSVCF